jgi:hypothetical protein
MSKQTQIQKVEALLKTDPHISPADMSKKLGIPLSSIYNLRSCVKKGYGDDPTVKVEPVVRRKYTKKKLLTYTARDINGNTFTMQVDDPQKEIETLNAWCLDWHQRYIELEKKYNELQKDNYRDRYIEAMAIVKYLESKWI